ncbi:MAG: outer membrane beta-barrel protein, partial [Bacteroidota bacterium]
IAANTIQAQIGIKAGINRSILTGPSEEINGQAFQTQDRWTGGQVGIFYDFSLSERLNLLLELNVEFKGVDTESDYHPILEYSAEETGFSTDIILVQAILNPSNLFYIQLPILVTFEPINNLSIYGGFNIGYLFYDETTDSRSYVHSTYLNFSSREELERADQLLADAVGVDNIFEVDSEFTSIIDQELVNRLVIGGNIGIKYDIGERWFVDARLNRDLTDFSKDENDRAILDPTPNAVRDDKDYITSGQFSVGFKF